MVRHEQLVSTLQQLAEHYLQCRQALQALDSRMQNAETRSATCEELAQILASIETQQSTYSSVLRQWQSPGFVPSSECRLWKQRTQTALESLLTVVQNMEAVAESARICLLPDMHQANRDQMVKTAYLRSTVHD